MLRRMRTEQLKFFRIENFFTHLRWRTFSCSFVVYFLQTDKTDGLWLPVVYMRKPHRHKADGVIHKF